MTAPSNLLGSLQKPDFRPQIHYAPQANWMNDPNGLVFVGGLYHLYYQYNPHSDTHAHMNWGKATSPDLVHWQEHDIALPEHEHQIFSGSAVLDIHNTSGFGAGDMAPLVACYTGHTPHNQSQFLAYSLDDGEHWTYHPEAVLDLGKQDFRDPKVFWHEPSAAWVMAVVHPNEHQIELFASANLHAWRSLSLFGPQGAVGGIWEVPELFPVQDEQGQERWVLKVDLHPGGPFGGSGVQYWLGNFDGQAFSAHTAAQWVDYGKDFYAALSWNGLGQRRVWLGWMNNWQYAREVPTPGQRGMMSLPREVFMLQTPTGPQLAQRPVPELQTLRGPETTLQAAHTLQAGRAYELQLAGGDIQLDFLSSAGLECQVTLTATEVSVLRPETAWTQSLEGYAGTHAAALPPLQGPQTLHIFVDSNSIEVFAAGGSRVISDLLYPSQPITALRLHGQYSGRLWPLAK